MERFRPVMSPKNHFLDHLTAHFSEGNNAIPVGEDVLSRKYKEEYSRVVSDFSQSMSYREEWQELCKMKDLAEMRNLGLMGHLTRSRFRSLWWRIYLNLFPVDYSNWLTQIRQQREQYEAMRLEYAVTPSSTDQKLDPSVNNPLSQDEQSPWNQYFEDSELKRVIRLDVERTFPEVEFFHIPRIQELMVSVLFCHVRKYPTIAYIQGMHEVLAPLIFALNFDHQTHSHACEQGQRSSLLQELMDEAYLEHDAFTLFEAVMRRLRAWYDEEAFVGHPFQKPNVDSQPFARPQDIGSTTKVVQHLTRIHDVLVKKHEPEVFSHLVKLEIPPQVYGIRWARLMFGREFPIVDLLSLWDAIFADVVPAFGFIEFVMVSMLSNIKSQLLEADYIKTLNLLMRYPPGADVQNIISMALYFRNPKQQRPPVRYTSVHPTQTVGGQPNIHRTPQRQSHSSQSPVTRSTSLPRSPSLTCSDGLKQRSVSVDQRGYAEDQEKARHGRHRRDSLSDDETMFNVTERPMSELLVMCRSTPIPTHSGSLERDQDNTVASSADSEDNSLCRPSRWQSLTTSDLITITQNCAKRLSVHQAGLVTRLSQLNIESDIHIRAAVDGISEVIEVLRKVRLKPNSESTTLPIHSPVSSLDSFHPVFSHPLQDTDSSPTDVFS